MTGGKNLRAHLAQFRHVPDQHGTQRFARGFGIEVLRERTGFSGCGGGNGRFSEDAAFRHEDIAAAFTSDVEALPW